MREILLVLIWRWSSDEPWPRLSHVAVIKQTLWDLICISSIKSSQVRSNQLRTRLGERVDIRQLLYFIGVLDAKSLHKAAGLLDIGQTALIQIHNLARSEFSVKEWTSSSSMP